MGRQAMSLRTVSRVMSQDPPAKRAPTQDERDLLSYQGRTERPTIVNDTVGVM